MKNPDDAIYIKNVRFQKINEKTFDNLNISKLQFFIILRSGVIDTAGNIYFFMSDGAFFMTQNEYSDDFIDKILSFVSEWKKINLYFCDDLFINPKIYDSFVKKLYTTNIRDYWFETAIDIYKNKTIL